MLTSRVHDNDESDDTLDSKMKILLRQQIKSLRVPLFVCRHINGNLLNTDGKQNITQN